MTLGRPKRSEAVMFLSIVLPAHNEAPQIALTHAALKEVLDPLIGYEMIFVDDGSTDGTWEALTQLQQEDPQVKILKLSRNFGKEAAICAGFDAVHPDAAAVLLMDCDLQHPPAVIPELLDKWQEGYDIVAGMKSDRGKESVATRLKANGFYRLFAKLSGFDLKNASDFQLLDRKVLEAWYRLPERDTFFRGLSLWLGFKRATVDFEVAERQTGETKWTFWSLLKLSVDAITGFSGKVLLFIPIMAMIFFLFFVIFGIHTLVNYFMGNAASGFTTVILLQLLIGGAILASLTLIALYIAKIFGELKARPRYLLSEVRFNAASFEEALRDQEKQLLLRDTGTEA